MANWQQLGRTVSLTGVILELTCSACIVTLANTPQEPELVHWLVFASLAGIALLFIGWVITRASGTKRLNRFILDFSDTMYQKGKLH